MRITTRLIAAPLGALLVSSMREARADGLMPVYSTPIPEGVAAAGFMASLVCAFAGLAVAIRRAGCVASIVLWIASFVAVLTTLLCARDLLADASAGAWGFIAVPAAMGFAVFAAFTGLWCLIAIAKRAQIGRVLLLLSCAIVMAVLCLALLRLTIDHWVDPYIPQEERTPIRS
jgi:hypothetical protein